ncbi:hypothetical protein EV424DRAFT_864631 [Suillus variegatus]|nr:hypothetical protein EV424DRAFT_864631 [Suillus variegatus]
MQAAHQSRTGRRSLIDFIVVTLRICILVWEHILLNGVLGATLARVQFFSLFHAFSLVSDSFAIVLALNAPCPASNNALTTQNVYQAVQYVDTATYTQQTSCCMTTG